MISGSTVGLVFKNTRLKYLFTDFQERVDIHGRSMKELIFASLQDPQRYCNFQDHIAKWRSI